MPRRQAVRLHLVSTPAETRGLENWARVVKALFRRKNSPGPIPHDLLVDVLADNGLRAQEQEREQHRPHISGSRF